jgi:uncharacterized membrane protein required for colicin V production
MYNAATQDLTIHTSINAFDAVVIAVLALSMLVAFFRGFVREVMSLFTWIGAGILTIYLFPHAVELVKAHVHVSAELAAGMAALGTYILMLILLSLLVSVLMRYVKTSSEVGVMDNLLGLLFGAVRGAFIVSLGYLMLSFTLPEDKEQYPDWLKHAKTQPYAEEGGMYLKQVAPKYIADLQKDMKHAQSTAAGKKYDFKEQLGHTSIPATLEPTPSEEQAEKRLQQHIDGTR